MRFLVIVKASKDYEEGKMPSHEELAQMGSFNEELANSGVMLAGEGLHRARTESGLNSHEINAKLPMVLLPSQRI